MNSLSKIALYRQLSRGTERTNISSIQLLIFWTYVCYTNKFIGFFIQLTGGLVIIFSGLASWAQQTTQFQWPLALMSLTAVLMLGSMLYLNRLPQGSERVYFMVPMVPFFPSLGILVNVYLMFQLSAVTWIRFAVWMTLGSPVAFPVGPVSLIPCFIL